jgi:acyl-coenzyme A thioesterase PaaI-like protein
MCFVCGCTRRMYRTMSTNVGPGSSLHVRPNKLMDLVQKINAQFKFSDRVKSWVLSWAFNSQIKYAGTTGIRVQDWDERHAIVHLKNRFRVRNHIGSVHATAMATLAESATGMVFGVHVPDTHIPLLKSINIEYNRLAKGDLKAYASITPEQIEQIRETEKGSTIIKVQVVDEEDKEPIKVQMEWAWTKKRSLSLNNDSE